MAENTGQVALVPPGLRTEPGRRVTASDPALSCAPVSWLRAVQDLPFRLHADLTFCAQTCSRGSAALGDWVTGSFCINPALTRRPPPAISSLDPGDICHLKCFLQRASAAIMFGSLQVSLRDPSSRWAGSFPSCVIVTRCADSD